MEIPSDQGGWIRETDHEEAYGRAGLETDGGEDEEGQSRAATILDMLGL